MGGGIIIAAGITLIAIGVLIVFAGILLSAKNSDTTVRGGGVIFLGPIPLIFGSDKKSALTISLIGLALMIVAYFLLRR
jgi:uncharacterized protein (TIGR00304 family)